MPSRDDPPYRLSRHLSPHPLRSVHEVIPNSVISRLARSFSRHLPDDLKTEILFPCLSGDALPSDPSILRRLHLEDDFVHSDLP